MRLLVTDLEATCCDKESIPREESEIIEIGSVIMEYRNGVWTELDDFTVFLKPEIHKTLTNFCTDLTKITQEMVDKAPDLPEAYKKYEDWARSYQVNYFASWGGYDYRQFVRSLKKHDMEFMFQKHECLNLKELYAKNKPLKKKRGIGLVGALRNEGMTFMGTSHRGIDDAKNMSRLLNICIEK